MAGEVHTIPPFSSYPLILIPVMITCLLVYISFILHPQFSSALSYVWSPSFFFPLYAVCHLDFLSPSLPRLLSSPPCFLSLYYTSLFPNIINFLLSPPVPSTLSSAMLPPTPCVRLYTCQSWFLIFKVLGDVSLLSHPLFSPFQNLL